MKNWPKVSIVIPTRGIRGDKFLDSEFYIKKCLDSVFKQDYPKEKIEVLIVDGESTDRTLEIARKYPVRIFNNPQKLAEPAKTLGFKHATGDLFFYLDSDAELVSKQWLKKLTQPFMDDSDIAGSFTRYYPNKRQTAFNRYVSFDPLQLWPMLSFLLPSIEGVIVKKGKTFDSVKINPKRTIPVGMCLYRKRYLNKVITNPDTFNYVDIAIPLQLAELGFDKFAYVVDAGMYHRRSNLWREVKRQKRDVTVTYLPVFGQRKFNYIDFNKKGDLLKIVLWVLWANLLIPGLVVGLYKTIKYRDWAGMYELPTNFILTNYVIYLFVSDRKGKELLKKTIFSFLK